MKLKSHFSRAFFLVCFAICIFLLANIVLAHPPEGTEAIDLVKPKGAAVRAENAIPQSAKDLTTMNTLENNPDVQEQLRMVREQMKEMQEEIYSLKVRVAELEYESAPHLQLLPGTDDFLP